MKTKILLTLLSLVIIGGGTWLMVKPKPHKVTSPPVTKDLHLEQISFDQLPGWKTANLQMSLRAFKVSCSAFLKKNPETLVGSEFISMRAKQWYPACNAANKLKDPTSNEIRDFFQTWFKPFEMRKNHAVKGLFTGYYSPLFKGSLKKTAYYSVPIYGLPKKLISAQLSRFNQPCASKKIFGRVVGQELVPYYTSKQIDAGALNGIAPVLAWVHSPLERLVLSIEGSGAIQLDDKRQLMLGYAGENGAKYTAIGKVLIDQGVMNYDNASMQHIEDYFKKHPEKMNQVLHRNESFVFFRLLKNSGALGAQGITLTPGYSMAVDRSWLPMGVPLWLNTTRPDLKSSGQKKLQRLMIAQDTGGAIRGPVRGDFYWGEGERAASIAGRMKNKGSYWLLLPNNLA
jgi:membrane-bound lytic murein transglycosylase A